MVGTIGETERSWRRYVFGVNPKRTLLRVWIWAISINLIFHSLLLPITVSGSSMVPTYKSGSRNLVNKLSYVHHQPKRGDVVVINVGGEDGLLIKRIVGLPGEVVTISNGRIEINGRSLEDDYADMTIPWTTQPVHLSDHEYFFIGDNRAHSVFGLITKDQIVGKVLF